MLRNISTTNIIAQIKTLCRQRQLGEARRLIEANIASINETELSEFLLQEVKESNPNIDFIKRLLGKAKITGEILFILLDKDSLFDTKLHIGITNSTNVTALCKYITENRKLHNAGIIDKMGIRIGNQPQLLANFLLLRRIQIKLLHGLIVSKEDIIETFKHSLELYNDLKSGSDGVEEYITGFVSAHYKIFFSKWKEQIDGATTAKILELARTKCDNATFEIIQACINERIVTQVAIIANQGDYLRDITNQDITHNITAYLEIPGLQVQNEPILTEAAQQQLNELERYSDVFSRLQVAQEQNLENDNEFAAHLRQSIRGLPGSIANAGQNLVRNVSSSVTSIMNSPIRNTDEFVNEVREDIVTNSEKARENLLIVPRVAWSSGSHVMNGISTAASNLTSRNNSPASTTPSTPRANPLREEIPAVLPVIAPAIVPIFTDTTAAADRREGARREAELEYYGCKASLYSQLLELVNNPNAFVKACQDANLIESERIKGFFCHVMQNKLEEGKIKTLVSLLHNYGNNNNGTASNTGNDKKSRLFAKAVEVISENMFANNSFNEAKKSILSTFLNHQDTDCTLRKHLLTELIQNKAILDLILEVLGKRVQDPKYFKETFGSIIKDDFESETSKIIIDKIIAAGYVNLYSCVAEAIEKHLLHYNCPTLERSIGNFPPELVVECFKRSKGSQNFLNTYFGSNPSSKEFGDLVEKLLPLNEQNYYLDTLDGYEKYPLVRRLSIPDSAKFFANSEEMRNSKLFLFHALISTTQVARSPELQNVILAKAIINYVDPYGKLFKDIIEYIREANRLKARQEPFFVSTSCRPIPEERRNEFSYAIALLDIIGSENITPQLANKLLAFDDSHSNPDRILHTLAIAVDHTFYYEERYPTAIQAFTHALISYYHKIPTITSYDMSYALEKHMNDSALFCATESTHTDPRCKAKFKDYMKEHNIKPCAEKIIDAVSSLFTTSPASWVSGYLNRVIAIDDSVSY